MYVIDLGYRRRKLRFATLEEASKTANKIFASTGIVLAITELKTRINGARGALVRQCPQGDGHEGHRKPTPNQAASQGAHK